MLFSGADIVRTSGSLRDRFEVLSGGQSQGEGRGGPQVESMKSSDNQLSQDQSKDALLRFAQFMNRPKTRKPLPKAHRFFSLTEDNRGKLLDIYA